MKSDPSHHRWALSLSRQLRRSYGVVVNLTTSSYLSLLTLPSSGLRRSTTSYDVNLTNHYFSPSAWANHPGQPNHSQLHRLQAFRMVFSLQTVGSHITHIHSLEYNFFEWLQGRGQHTKEEVPVCSRPASQTSGPLRSSAVETNGSVHPSNGYLLHNSIRWLYPANGFH
ncbi:hypothetical protein BO79DRAFT_39347 [Aspergillus costaricaensis CBS 115574]|uniref:Uncharacterized protein n=1 Tax=Aspergillus costaricaensis CBS 115574 TaxID=1448317 RepID=A0ACD1I8V1_9EURO|nr:hypothetical protein BO79DRAFT_39347 [Aspergillus costaricaensis CBS 115574]RAK86195.1 hypothetical protein BO79DRAFT_39347 [Aspergillus costaricaensis CBS 115574]